MKKFYKIFLTTLLLTLGVGQMWGADVQQNAIIYMDNSAAGWDYSNIYFVINNTNGYPMTAIANTKLYVHKRSAGTWSEYSNVRFFAATSSWGGDDASMGSESNMVSYGANLTNTQTNYGFNGNNFYVIKLDKAGTKASSSTRANLSTSYIGNAYTSMNKTITVKAKVSTNGGSTYSEATSPGTLSASSNKFSNYNTCGTSTSLSSGTISCGYTATTTLTAADAAGYDFVGWYNSSGTQQTTSKTLTIYPTANATYYAYYKTVSGGTITLTAGTGGQVSNDNSSWGSSATITGITTATDKNIYARANSGYTFNTWTKTSGSGTIKTNAASGVFTTVASADAALTASFTENMRSVTISVSPSGAGTLNKTSASVGVTTTTTVTATARPGYRFTGWTATNCSVASTSSASTTLSGNGSSGSGTLVANFSRTYAYVQGRMTVYNSARNSETHTASSKGGWDENSTRIAMDYDGTNHWFYRHTYKTPAELKAQISSNDQWFSIARSNNSGSWSGKTTYHPSSNQDLTTTGSANKKAAQTSTTTYNYKFNSATTTGYAILYFDEAGVWYELEHTLEYNANGGTGSAPASTTYYDHGVNATAASNTYTRAGYTFSGWKTGASSGTSYAAGASVPMNSNITLYAQWTPVTYTISFSQSGTGYASGGQTADQTATYGAAMPTPISTPTAANGYAFMGYWDGADGTGTQYYNADGTSAHAWDKTANTTLHAYFKKAAITSLTFDAPNAAYEPGGTVGVTPVVSPIPNGATVICWEVLRNNDNPLDPQPTITANPSAVGAKVTFPAETTSGSYKVKATLRLGSDCNGTELSTQTMSFQVAGDHNVTVQYKCGTETIRSSATLEGIKPLAWSDAITAPTIFGYTFEKWVAEDGVSITVDDGAHTVTETTTATIKIKAIYDGKLTAKYTQNNIIYFKNTLGWSSVYVNFYTGSYWNNPKGSGNNGVTNRNKAMTRLGETDVWYYDYGAESITPSKYVSFTSGSQDGAENFWGSGTGVNVVYPVNNADNIHTDARPDDNGFYAKTPMFVPLAGQATVVLNNSGGGKANYYNRGYWTKYTPGTGYILKIYNNEGNMLLKSIPFTSADELMPMTAVVDLEASTNYKYELMREGDVYYGNDGTMTYTNHGQTVPWEMSWKEGGHKCGFSTNAAGDYTFHLTYSAYSNQYRLRMSYDYPIATGDYRIIYKDNVHTAFKPSAIVPKVNNGKDTVSFFIRPGQTPVMKIQQATVNSTTGVVTWSAGTDITASAGLTSLPTDSVYNICLQMNESGAISVENVERYLGDFYIRTDAANNKWDNFKNADHAMTYSEYSETNSDYTHYWMAHTWRDDNTNIKFVIANDYSPCISDTMIRSNYRGSDEGFVSATGVISPEANIRFMWNKNDNTINRAYLSPAKKDGSQFLVLRGYNGGSGEKDDNLLSEGGNELEGNPGDSGTNNHAGGDHCMQFTDNENWIYEAMVQVKPDSYVKLFARFAETLDANELPATYTDFYYKGKDNNTFDASNAIKLITGSGDHLLVRVIYDFKTDRLLAAYIPSGNISTDMAINADVMFIREHQGDISQVTFSGADSKISAIKTAYAVLRFNKWTLNNKSKTGSHEPLAVPLSRYERDLFYISFPFDVNLNEVFGFGTYGVHWIIEEYDGAGRAEKGFWKDSPTFWKFITNRNGKVLKKNVGYLLALDLDELGVDNSVWGVAENDRAELFFPSSGTMPAITSASVTHELPAHTCTINRNTPQGDRRIADSHWNIMGVPTYVNTTNISFANTTWTTGSKDPEAGKLGPKFLYTWNADDNTLTPTTASGFNYHAMHAYTVQYYGNVTWTTSVSPSSIVAREQEEPHTYEWCLELQQEEKMIDRTYVQMTDEEEATTGFEFGYDMSKDLNKNKAGIYSFITTAESTEMAAGNCMPLETEQTTIVPLGVFIATTGDYTFAMPAGTSGVGVTLVDSETNVRTSLSALDYTVNLTAGDYTDRFFLEISPVKGQTTGLEPGSDSQEAKVKKLLIDGILYIVRDGKMFDARGARVE